MSSNRPTVLILASDPAFARDLTANWPQDQATHSGAPEFIVLDEAFSSDLQGNHYDLAIADASGDPKHHRKLIDKRIGNNKGKKTDTNRDHYKDDHLAQGKLLKRALAGTGRPAIIIDSPAVRDVYKLDGTVIELRREPGIWPAIAGLIGREILRRLQAESSAIEAGKICVAAEAEATLGRYMVEMRTNVNNALTTVLGNAELLVLEPGLPASVLAQADSIRNMALRLHEVFQRFSSLEKELTVAARESGKKAAHAVAGKS